MTSISKIKNHMGYINDIDLNVGDLLIGPMSFFLAHDNIHTDKIVITKIDGKFIDLFDLKNQITIKDIHFPIENFYGRIKIIR